MASALHSNCLIKLSTGDGSKGIEVNVDYAHFMSLEMERIWGDSANKFTLKVLDSTAYEVESILLAGSRNLSIKYYVDDGDRTKPSKEFEGSVWDYSVDFINDRTILTLTGTCGVSVKDIYTLYNRLWNKVPILSEDITTEIEGWWGAITSRPEEIIKFRYATTDSGETKFQVSLAYSTEKDKNGKEVRKPYYFDCDMINIPVRPSDLVNLIATGGKLSALSPFDKNNKSIKYDDFAESGFNFGSYVETDSSGNSVTKPISWGTALEWKANYSDLLGGSIGFGSDSGSLDDMSLVRKTIATVIIIEQYFKTLGKIESSGWTVGHIEPTEPICADLSQVKLSNTKFISDVLASKSFTSVDKESSTRANYFLSFDEGKLYFEPAKIEASPKAKIIVGQYLNPNTIGDRDGTDIYAGDMILSYSYSSNTAAYIAGEGSNELAGINYVTGEAINAEGLSSKTKEKLGVIEASYTDFNQGAIPTLGGVSSTSVEELVGRAQKDWTALAQTSFKAEVQILGNLNLKCGDYIEIINIPGGKMGKHHTSGIYLIMKIKENISKGTYISTLTLVKNAANSGSGVSVTKK